MSVIHRPLRHSRPTIGLLCDVPLNQYSCDMWAGVRDAAHERDANLLYFAGGILNSSLNYSKEANVIYERVSSTNLDGLVLWGGQLAHVVGTEGVSAFCQRFRPLPMVSIELAIEGIPSLLIDNYQGMYDVVSHLIEKHGYRRIAYLDYPTQFPLTLERYRGYMNALRDHDIPLDLNLVTDGSGIDLDYEKLDMGAGQEGAYILFEQRRLRPQHDIEAIATVADPTTFGALTRLQARGIRIPTDVALVGFDDLAEARYQHPPLTTVGQSFYDQGRQAVDVLLAQLRGEDVPDVIPVPMTVIVRRSCGCPDPIIGHTRLESGITLTPPEAISHDEGLARRAESGSAFCHSQKNAPKDAPDMLSQTRREQEMFACFLSEVTGERPESFSLAWENMLYAVVDGGGDLCRWHAVLTEWYRRFFTDLSPDTLIRAKNLWQHARILLDALMQREQTYQQAQAIQHTHLLQRISNALITTFNLSELTDILARELPYLGIHAGYLALYAEAASPAAEATLIFAYNEHGPLEFLPSERRIPPGRLLSEGVFPQEKRYSFMVAPLHFQTTQIGFALLDAGQQPPEGIVYESLRNQLSSALQGSLLIQRLQERTAELTREKYILDTFMANVPDYIYFKDLQSRITKANQAHAKRLGLSDPSEELGKTDFDFFPKEQAQKRYEQEQMIIQTGQPLLAFEERALGKGWVLTTKMPLRDEYGQIIGTFGISHDISKLKQIQTELEQSYIEIEQRVAQRTAELQQEIAERLRAETEIRHLQHFLQNIIDSMPAVMMGVDTEGRVTFWNLEAVKVTGLTAAAVQGKRFQEAFPPLTELIAPVEHTLQSQTPQHLSKIPLQWQGATRYADITIYPLIANAIQGAVIFAIDVTEQVRIEDIMIQSEKMWTVGGLASGMAHEINNPLSVMLQGIQNIRRRLALDGKHNQMTAAHLGLTLDQIHAYLEARNIWRYLQEMQTAGRHAEKIVANILNFGNYATSEVRPVDLNHLLDNVLDLLANDADVTTTDLFSKVAVLRDYDATLSRVPCITNEMEQVLLNMLRNAIQALAERPAGALPAFIRLCTRQTAEYVKLEIEDNGIGMDESTRKQIFDPFFTTRAVGKGAGLGLAVAYFIVVVHHHGQISVTSTPQQGTTFTLLLPLRPPISPGDRELKAVKP